MLRRDFLTALAAAPLAACAPAPRPDTARDDPDAALGPIEPALAVYNWSDYIAPDTIAGFEREFGVRVSYDTYESNEEMFAKLVAGASGYDIAVPSSYLLDALRSNRMLMPLHRGHLGNWNNLAAEFLDLAFDPGNRVTMPWQWGMTGLAWRRDLVADAPDGWGTLLDARGRGRMTMMDDGREVLGAMLKLRGHSLNATAADELARARSDAIVAKRLLRAYKSAPVKGDLIAGDVWIAQLWNGDAAQAAAEQPAIDFLLPTEGSAIWTDGAVVLRDAPHPRAAHEFLNYCLRPDVAARIADATGYGSPNRAALPRQTKRPVPWPTGTERARLEYFEDLGPATETWDRLWTEIKSA
jgi:spermidine/putrescine transport system substrate-binding protein